MIAAGSTRVARQAGMAVDKAAVTRSMAITPAKVGGSSGCTPNSTVSSTRDK